MFENRLKNLRESRGFSMRQLAIELGMPYTTYINYEKNMREPNSEMLISIADFFDVSTDYLLGRTLIKKFQYNSSKPLYTNHETEVISAYRDQPEIQPAVDKLLGVSGEHLHEQLQSEEQKKVKEELQKLRSTDQKQNKVSQEAVDSVMDKDVDHISSNQDISNEASASKTISVPIAAFDGKGVEFVEITEDELKKIRAALKELGLNK